MINSTEKHQQFGPGARERILQALERRAWGDVAAQIEALEAALRCAVEALRSDLVRWNDEVGQRFADNEFSLSADDVADLNDGERAAYVARLVENVAMCWGDMHDDRGPRVLDGPGPLLREIESYSGPGTPRRHY